VVEDSVIGTRAFIASREGTSIPVDFPSCRHNARKTSRR
jgi:hypothetical protein